MSSEGEDEREKKFPSEIEEEEINETQSCNDEADSIFKIQYTILREEKIISEEEYLLYVDANKSFDKIVTGASNGVAHVFKMTPSSFEILAEFKQEPKTKQLSSCGVKFLTDDENILLYGNTNGYIKLYDLRTNKVEFTFEDFDDDRRKPIVCFDINNNNRLISAGTEQIDDSAYLLFFDIRQKKLMGGYWESFQDEITSVKFHPTKPDCLSSGSLDGLINIFDISKNNEDDALQYVVNINCSVMKMNWHRNIYNQNQLSCITGNNELNIYNAEGDALCEFVRLEIAEALLGIPAMDCNPINCHSFSDGGVFLLAGNSNSGRMQSLRVNNKKLMPHGKFLYNKQNVRDSVYDQENDLLLTVGEEGIVTLWKREESIKSTPTSNLKMNSKTDRRLHTRKPYEKNII